ncbi:MAG: hypothetical protein AB1861_27735 [Cyanobacteriota bacterium]
MKSRLYEQSPPAPTKMIELFELREASYFYGTFNSQAFTVEFKLAEAGARSSARIGSVWS